MTIESVELTTARLVLRPVRAEDFDSWAAFMADPDVTRFLGGPQSRFEAWVIFRAIGGGWLLDGFSSFSVFEKVTGRWIGYAGPSKPEGWPGGEIACGLIQDFWGAGYATEATTATIDWAFEHLGWDEVIHCIAPEHADSKRLARKLGAEYRGIARLPWFAPHHEFPAEIWGQTREKWRASHSVRRNASAATSVRVQ